MPPLVRKMLVIAAVDGLVLQPVRQQQKPTPSIQIKYATQDITTVSTDEIKGSTTLEIHGIIGLLKVASGSWLIALTGREQVAQIKGRSIYAVTGISLIPLASQVEAQRAIDQSTQGSKKPKSKPEIESDDASDDEDIQSGNVTAEEDAAENLSAGEESGPTKAAPKQESSIAQDVMSRKGQYGRFAERWFSKKGWVSDKRRVLMNVQDKSSEQQSKSTESLPSKVAEANAKEGGESGNLDGAAESKNVTSLLPKLLRTTKLLLTSRSFFFSYDYDLTRRVGYERDSNSDIPLHKRVDPLFFWNRSLSAPLIDAGQHSFVLPLLQGFIGQKAFTVEITPKDSKDSISNVKEDVGEVIELQETAAEQSRDTEDDKSREFLVTLISRRSVKRAGLRYLRRGVDEDGNVANAVETEQILSDPTWGSSFGTHSFTQIRGSIPLFFTQSPYSFKPMPTLQHNYNINHRAFSKHFAHLRERYGAIQVATLVEKRGPEGTVGNEYAEHTKTLSEELPSETPAIGYEWFDFHQICAGMKFEKVSVLMDILQPTLKGYGFTDERDGRVTQRQAGVLRTNCMDCLDRTNVVQSAAGAWALETQLADEADINLDLNTDSSTQWFNALWADNGDAISKQYSSTAALKGDFTRTRRRDYRGAINDFGLTLTRYYNNIVNDYFSQTTIDYLLGNVTEQVFQEFEENLMTADPSVSMRTVRQHAIDTSAKIVIADHSEEVAGGWTVATPAQGNTLRTLPLREIVLLLTDAALYAVRYDWNTEKVQSFERIGLDSIARVRHGTYVTSTFSQAQLDPERNVGLVVTYRATAQNAVKHNTRSMSTMEAPKASDGEAAQDAAVAADDGPPADADPASSSSLSPDPPPHPPLLHSGQAVPGELQLLAVKALPTRSSLAASAHRDDADAPQSEKAVVGDVVGHLVKVMGMGTGSGRKDTSGEKDSEEKKEEKGVKDESKDQAQADMVHQNVQWLEEGDIIGPAEAKKSTGLLETLGHRVKKMVWA